VISSTSADRAAEPGWTGLLLGVTDVRAPSLTIRALFFAGAFAAMSASSQAIQVEITYAITPPDSPTCGFPPFGTCSAFLDDGSVTVRWSLTGTSLFGSFAAGQPGTLVALKLTTGSWSAPHILPMQAIQSTSPPNNATFGTWVGAPRYCPPPGPIPDPYCYQAYGGYVAVQHRSVAGATLLLRIILYHQAAGSLVTMTGAEVSRVAVPEPSRRLLTIAGLGTMLALAWLLHGRCFRSHASVVHRRSEG
jgi:hypothetical protein